MTPGRQVGSRLRVLWLVKLTGMIAGITAFFIVYFQLLNHPHFRVTTVPLIAADRLVGFLPAALPAYLSLWVYILIPPALLNNRRDLLRYGLAAVALSAVGFVFFLFWPTAVPVSDVDWPRHPSFSFLKAVDAAGNAFPSLHVAFAVFTAIGLARLLREMGAGRAIRALNWLWCLGIAYSALATRQHVALDALSGAVLGAAVAFPLRTRLAGKRSSPHDGRRMTNSILGRGGLHHICVKTRDWDRTMRFYQEALGFTVKLAWQRPPQRAVMLDPGDGNYVEVFEDLAYFPAPDGALHHFALRTTRIDEVTERVRAFGAKVTMEPKSLAIETTNGMGQVQVRISFCEGPNGETIEFLQNELT